MYQEFLCGFKFQISPMQIVYGPNLTLTWTKLIDINIYCNMHPIKLIKGLYMYQQFWQKNLQISLKPQ